jgi:DNA polymerase III subunit delta'
LINQGANLVSFEQMVGQSVLTKRLRSALEQDKVAHAVIIAGPAGSGKLTLASIYARALMCQATRGKPCNVCTSCKKALGGNHADLHIVKPEEDGKSLGVDEARSLQRLIDVKPYEGGRAVVIVRNAHDMTVAAQNALLKTLEEPPEHVVLILLAESLSPLLPTILSRCVVYTMARLSHSEMISVLQRHGYAGDSKTMHATSMADGRPGRALELLADDSYWVLKDKSLDVLEQLVKNKRLASAMKFTQDNRAKVGEVLTIWECAVRDAAVTLSGSSASLLSGAAPGFLQNLQIDLLEAMLSACAQARKALDGNAIYTMTMDNLLIELAGGI